MLAVRSALPLSRVDMIKWLNLLSPDPAIQRDIVFDLLRHATGDSMTMEDRATCIAALEYLSKHAQAHSAPPEGAHEGGVHA